MAGFRGRRTDISWTDLDGGPTYFGEDGRNWTDIFGERSTMDGPDRPPKVGQRAAY